MPAPGCPAGPVCVAWQWLAATVRAGGSRLSVPCLQDEGRRTLLCQTHCSSLALYTNLVLCP
jgi:hypothetical protein